MVGHNPRPRHSERDMSVDALSAPSPPAGYCCECAHRPGAGTMAQSPPSIASLRCLPPSIDVVGGGCVVRQPVRVRTRARKLGPQRRGGGVAPKNKIKFDRSSHSFSLPSHRQLCPMSCHCCSWPIVIKNNLPIRLIPYPYSETLSFLAKSRHIQRGDVARPHRNNYGACPST